MDIFIPSNGKHPLEDDYSDAKYERHPHGIIFSNGKEVAATLMCPHCGEHFVSRKGSGVRRSFCFRHQAVTCEKEFCIKNCVDIYTDYQILSVREF